MYSLSLQEEELQKQKIQQQQLKHLKMKLQEFGDNDKKENEGCYEKFR